MWASAPTGTRGRAGDHKGRPYVLGPPGAADMTCEAANARASVVAAFELLSTKRAARLPKKHGNMAL